jgi:hypothetical protein
MVALFGTGGGGQILESNQITPGIVRQTVLSAMAHGWSPKETGGPYRVSNTDEILKAYNLKQVDNSYHLTCGQKITIQESSKE